MLMHLLMLRYLQNLVLHLQGVHAADGVLLWNTNTPGWAGR